MKILITGAAGFIGYHLCKRCINENYSIIGFDNINDYYDVNLKEARLNDLYNFSALTKNKFTFVKGSLEDKFSLKEVFDKYSPNCVINLAAQAGVRYSIENPSAYIQSNIVGFGDLIELCRNHEINNFIYASSSSVYGGNRNMPFSENKGVDHPISLYAATKRSNELIAHSYSHLYSLPTTGLRFFTVYGPWGRPDMALFLFTKAIFEEKKLKIFNNGEMLRDFTYVDDIVESMFRLIAKPATVDKNYNFNFPDPSTSWAPHRIFNIGNSNPSKLMDYINQIENVIGKKAIKEFLPMQPGDVKATFSDTSALEDWIGFKPKTSINDGIEKFIFWYRNFYNV